MEKITLKTIIVTQLVLLCTLSCTHNREFENQLESGQNRLEERNQTHLDSILDGLQTAYNTFNVFYTENPTMRSSTMPEPQLKFENLEPLWKDAFDKEYTTYGYTFIYIPFNADFAVMPIHDSFSGKTLQGNSKPPLYSFLTRFKDHELSIASTTFFLFYLPSYDYYETHDKLNIIPGEVPHDFSGELHFYNLSGYLESIHTYNEGECIGKKRYAIAPKKSSELRMVVQETCTTTVYVTNYYHDVEAGGKKIKEGIYDGSTYHTTVTCNHEVISWTEDKPSAYDNMGGGGGSTNNEEDKKRKQQERRERLSSFSAIIEDYEVRATIEEPNKPSTATTSISNDADVGGILEDFATLYNLLRLDSIASQLLDYAENSSNKITKLIFFNNSNELKAGYIPSTREIYINIDSYYYPIAFFEELTHHFQNIIYPKGISTLEDIPIEAECKLVCFMIGNKILKALAESPNFEDSKINFWEDVIHRTPIKTFLSIDDYQDIYPNLYSYVTTPIEKSTWLEINQIYTILKEYQDYLSTISDYKGKGNVNYNWEYKLVEYIYSLIEKN